MPLHVVRIADYGIATSAGDTLVTYTLGSCLGISAWCPLLGIGGLVHCLLPLARVSPQKAKERPGMFVSSGLPALFKALIARGAKREYLVLKAAGGASLLGDDASFQTGPRNIAALRGMLERNNLHLDAADLGGNTPRTMLLDVASGQVRIKTPTKVTEL